MSDRLLLAERFFGLFIPGPWLAIVLGLYSVTLLLLTLRALKRPRQGGFVATLPHLAVTPLLIALVVTVAGFVRDAVVVTYHGAAPLVPAGATAGVFALPVGVVSYLILMPLSLMARNRSRRKSV